MDRAGELLGQGGVDHALAGDAGEPLERRGFDHHIEVALAAFARAGMAGMAMRVIDDFEV